MKQSISYKQLYLQSQQQLQQQEAVVALLQQQQRWLTEERQSHLRQLNDQKQELVQGARLLSEAQQLINRQATTIGQLQEKTGLQQQLLQEQDEQIKTQQQQIKQQQKDSVRLKQVQYELGMLKRQIYGIKSEKRHVSANGDSSTPVQQLAMVLDVDSWGSCQLTNRRQVGAHLRVAHVTSAHVPGSRNALPEGLPEELILLDVPDRPAGARCIGHEEQRQLACDPGRWYIKVIRRPVYLVASEDKLNYRQLIAPLPSHPIERCKLDISVLVLLFIDKYQYHLPIWRQQQRLRQYGIDLPYSTLCWIVNRVCETLRPLWHLLMKEILASGVVHMDETRYRVLDTTKKTGKKSHIGWIWAMMNPVQRIVCFTYQKGRGKKDVDHLLKGYTGNLMTDAYGSYTKYGRQPGVVHQHCASHARRYFAYAMAHDSARATYVLDNFFGPLYGIEQECKAAQLDYDAITEKRQAEAVPLFNQLRQWLETELPKVTPRTPMHQAISYTLNHFNKLMQYTTDGMLAIDNNILEGQIRSIALGRNNSLFAGSHLGGELAAIAYSFVATCKLQQINPNEWLPDVLRRVVDCPEDKLITLLPQFWKPISSSQQKSA